MLEGWLERWLERVIKKRLDEYFIRLVEILVPLSMTISLIKHNLMNYRNVVENPKKSWF